MFIMGPAAALEFSSQQDGKHLNFTQLIGWLYLQPDAGALALSTKDFH